MRWLILCVLIGVAVAIPTTPKASVCGYESCPKAQAGKINVHLVPHTHDDVGWLSTVDRYYYDSVQYILDNVVTALLQNPERKFIYVETAFFWKWWVEQTTERQDRVKYLVNEGRLEFIGGAWSMNDEGTTHYQSTIDQFTYGHRKLNETFGVCGQPRVGWQIDPFGHSREQASLMAQYYFDGLFFARLDYQDKNHRMETKTMETIWETSPSLGDSADILTHALYNHYSTPGGFCWDDLCGDDPIIDNHDLPDYNVDSMVNNFVDFCRKQSQYFKSNNIIVLFGDDFHYKSALKNYKNIDKLIKYVNGGQSVINLFYSTPSCYLNSLNEANITFNTKQDDFFPYADNVHTYWTGYFTSRPTIKYFERLGNRILQVAKQLSALSSRSSDDLEELQDAMGVLQHHDAVSGTEVLGVAKDYARLLDNGIVKSEAVISSALSDLMTSDSNALPLDFDGCRLRNISECAISTEKDAFLVTIYNPLSRPVDYFVRVPVQPSEYTVQAPDGSQLLTQTFPIPEHVTRIPGRTSTAKYELHFKAEALPALGYRSYYVAVAGSNQRQSGPTKVWKPVKGQAVTIGDATTRITFDANTKFLKSISVRAETYDVAQSLQYYVSHDSFNNTEQNSGAYIFRPLDTTPVKITEEADTTVIEGPLVHEVRQVFSDWATQIIRHYNDQPVVEFEWLVGPIPIDDNKGKEVISKFTTSIPTNGTFFTDSSGREVLERKRNFRPTWDLDLSEPVAGNYYPVVSHISIDNSSVGLAIITDRAQGGSSLQDGSLELMVHRRVLEDLFGIADSIDPDHETLYARGSHFVLIGETSTSVSTKAIRLLELRKLLDGLVLLSDVTGLSQEDVAKNYKLEYSPLNNTLPEQVQILTLEPWKDGSLLLRLENIFNKEEEPNPVTIDLNNLFNHVQIVSAKETTLSALKWKDEASRLQWRKEGVKPNKKAPEPKKDLALDSIELGPKEIRTFIVEVVPKY